MIAWASSSPHTVQEISCRVSNKLDNRRFEVFWNVGLKKKCSIKDGAEIARFFLVFQMVRAA